MKDRVVLITGGARGIGLGIAEAFLGAGARVMIADLGARAADWSYQLADQHALEQAAAERAGAGEIRATEVDVTDAASCEAAVQATLDAYGARELNARFAARWGRPMDSAAWAGFQAMKIAFEGAQFGGGADAESIAAYLARDGSVFDVHKGIGCSFRPWDHQLRQSLYLVKVNAEAPSGMRVQELNARADLVGELPAIYMPGTDPVERLDQLGDITAGTSCTPG